MEARGLRIPTPLQREGNCSLFYDYVSMGYFSSLFAGESPLDTCSHTHLMVEIKHHAADTW